MFCSKYVIVLGLISTTALGQMAQHGFVAATAADCGWISARVYTASGKPATGAVLELRSIQTGAAQQFNMQSGDVADISCAKPGTYRVIAHLGTMEASEEIELGPGESQTVNLRLPDAGSAEGPSTVSTAQLRVPDKARKAIAKAEQRLAKRDKDGAMKYIGEALKAYPDDSDAYRLRGLIKLTDGNTSDAITDLDHAVKLDSNNVLARIVLGAAFNAMSKFKEAAASISSVLPMAPQAWQAQFELGKAYAGLGKIPQAIAALNKALELNPKFPPIRYLRGAMLMRARQYADATADLQQYLQADPKGPAADAARQMLASAEAEKK